jgi:catechol 2,3-dioxygenase-like lactoylglutathione lyase family enzyme
MGFIRIIAATCILLFTIPYAHAVEPAHFHHVRLNVTHPEKTLEFYEKYLGAVPIRYRNVVDGLFTERSFILFNKVDSPPPTKYESALWHIGWGGVDGPSEYNWLKNQGVEFTVPLTPLGDSYYMYLAGPDREAVEIFTGPRHHRFNHIHLFADDVNATTQWYVDHLGLTASRPHVAKPGPDAERRLWSNAVTCDNVGIIIFGRPDPGDNPSWWPAGEVGETFVKTDGRAINHYAFSYRDIAPVFERMQANGVEIVAPIATDPQLGHESFYIRAPDNVLVEIVRARPIPEGVWD